MCSTGLHGRSGVKRKAMQDTVLWTNAISGKTFLGTDRYVGLDYRDIKALSLMSKALVSEASLADQGQTFDVVALLTKLNCCTLTTWWSPVPTAD